jgi:hypothetical protein
MTEQPNGVVQINAQSNVARDNDYRSFYANLSRLRVTNMDISIVFARVGVEVRPGVVGSVDLAEVVLPPSQIKVLAQALTVVAESYEETWGKITQVPRQIDFNALRELVRSTKPPEIGG